MADYFDSLNDQLQTQLTELCSEALDVTTETRRHLARPFIPEGISDQTRFQEQSFHAIGGMKRIFKVKDVRTNRFVALAELKDQRPSEAKKNQFLREARIAAALEHPHIMPVYDLGVNNYGQPFFTMKFLRDESLYKVLKEWSKRNPVYMRQYPRRTLLAAFLKICEAVAYAHSCGVIHLDIKPANIMIGAYGEVYLCDWGLAKIVHEAEESSESPSFDATTFNDITLSGQIKGTPGFMAPEQIDRNLGRKDERTDIYALGALLYHILTLKKPLSGLPVQEILQRTLSGEISKPSEISIDPVSKDMEAVCLKAMQPAPALRYPKVSQLIEAFEQALQNIPNTTDPIHNRQVLAIFWQRFRLPLLIASLLLTAVLFILPQDTLEPHSPSPKVTQQATPPVVQHNYYELIEENKQLKSRHQRLTADLAYFSAVPSLKQGTELYLSGIMQGVENPLLPFTHGTVCFWFKPQATSQYPYLFQLGNLRWHLDNFRSSGGLVEDGGDHWLSAEACGGPLWDRWHYMAIRVETHGAVSFWIDGTELTTTSHYESTGGFSLGGWFSKPGRLPVDIAFDEVSIWDRSLSHAELILLQKRSLSVDEPGLKAYYKLDENLKDQTGNGWHLMANGPITFK